MRIIISPAKQMKVNTEIFECTELPELLTKTAILKDWIRSLSYDGIQFTYMAPAVREIYKPIHCK